MIFLQSIYPSLPVIHPEVFTVFDRYVFGVQITPHVSVFGSVGIVKQ